VRILQYEKKTFLTVIRFQTVVITPVPIPLPRFSLHRRKPAEDVDLRVQNHSQSVCVAVTSAVKFFCCEIIVTASTLNFEMFPMELCKDLRKVRNDPRIERCSRRDDAVAVEREREENELAPEAEKAVKSGWMEQQGMAVQQFVSSESKLFRNPFAEIRSNLFFLT
jgi:hypothetical protein